jgi:type II secretory pathway pseudopilin PulG
MISSSKHSTAGFTYIAALVMVVIMGIMLGAVGQSMKIVMKRETEKELIFRGLQYRNAIELWTRKGAMPLLELKFLIQDPRDPSGKAKYLRKLYKDPITGEDWKPLVDPNTKEIYGVASTCNDGEKCKPMKRDNFPEEIKTFKDKDKYSEWEFVFKRILIPAGATAAGGVQKVPSLPLSTPEGP